MGIPQQINNPSDGGAVVQTTSLELISPSVLHEVGAINLARQSGGVIRTGLQTYNYPKIEGEVTASTVSEGSAYGLEGVSFDAETVSLSKIGLALAWTDEFLRATKSVDGVDAEIQNRVDRAFAKAWDVNILGLENGSAASSSFAFDLNTGVSNTVDITDTSGAGIKDAISQAVGEIYEDTGSQATGVLVPSDVPQIVRDTKVSSTEAGGVTTTNTSAFGNGLDPFWGLNTAVSHNLARVGDETADSTCLVVGDFSTLRVLIHADVESEVSRVTTMDGTSGFETDQVYTKFRSYGTVYSTNPSSFRRLVIPAAPGA